MKKTILFAVFAGLMLFTCGCTSPPSEGGTSVPATEDKTVVTVTEDSAAGDVGTPAFIEKPAGDDIASEVMNILDNRMKQYTVSYETLVSMGGEEFTEEMTYYVKGEKVRVDTSYEMMDGEKGVSRIYILEDGMVMCMQEAGAGWTCMKMASSETGMKDPDEELAEMEENFESGEVSRLPDKVVAGVNTKCYRTFVSVGIQETADQGVGDVDYVYCLSNEGVPMYMEIKTGSMTTVQEAKTYRNTAIDSDFVPPAEPVDMAEAFRNMPGEGGFAVEGMLE